MKRPDDDVLLKDMADHARMAVTAAAGKARQDLDEDPVLAAALERFIEVVGEAASRVSDETRSRLPGVPWTEIIGMRALPGNEWVSTGLERWVPAALGWGLIGSAG
jgi:uncharacterized protein with HEPN domain